MADKLYDPDGSRRARRERWYEQGLYGTATFPDAMADGVARFGDHRTVFVSGSGENEVLVSDLYGRSIELAGTLQRLGVKAGDVVAIQVPNWVEGNITFQAAMLIGAVVLPIVHIYGPAEVSYLLRESGAKVLVVPEQWRNIDYMARLAQIERTDALEHVVVIGSSVPSGALDWYELAAAGGKAFTPPSLHPDDVALMVFTSGTTSSPKGVLHSHNTLLSMLRAQSAVADGSHSVTLSPWPAGHIAGIISILRTYFSGAESVLMDQWNADVAARLVERYRVTSSSGTAYFITSLLDASEAGGHDISSLQTYTVGAASVPPEVVRRCDRLGIATYRAYGSTEQATVTTGSPDDPLEKRAQTEGAPFPGNEIRIVDEQGLDVAIGEDGEVLIAGPAQFLGYQQDEFNEEAFAHGGWFRTGDIGRLDDDGYLTITDRKKDVIIRGGENIASKEVEDLLSRHPAVAEVAVVAMPDDRLGERVCAYVVPRDCKVPSLEEVQRHFAEHGVAKQKTPERIVPIDELPRTASGKVKKFELRDRIRAEIGRGETV